MTVCPCQLRWLPATGTRSCRSLRRSAITAPGFVTAIAGGTQRQRSGCGRPARVRGRRRGRHGRRVAAWARKKVLYTAQTRPRRTATAAASARALTPSLATWVSPVRVPEGAPPRPPARRCREPAGGAYPACPACPRRPLGSHTTAEPCPLGVTAALDQMHHDFRFLTIGHQLRDAEVPGVIQLAQPDP